MDISIYGAALSFLLHISAGESIFIFISLYYLVALSLIYVFGLKEALLYSVILPIAVFISSVSHDVYSVLMFSRISLFVGIVFFVLVAEFFVRERRDKHISAVAELNRIKLGIDHLSEEDSQFDNAVEQQSRRHENVKMLDNKLDDLVKLIQRVFGARTVIIFNLAHSTNELYVRSACSESNNLDMNCRIKIGKGVVGWVAVKEQPLLTPSRRKSLKDLNYYSAEEDIHSFIGVPISVKGKLEGVLTADHREEGAFFEADVSLVKSFASYIAELVETSRILNSVEEESLEIKALYQCSRTLSSEIRMDVLEKEILSVFGQIVGFSCGVIAVKEGNGEYSVISSDRIEVDNISFSETTWLKWFLDNRDEALLINGKSGSSREMPYIFNGEKFDINASFLALPIKVGKSLKGAVVLVSEENGFAGKDVNVLSILANHAAVVLENARMYKQMEELATTDGLTGLYNHRHFQQTLDEEFKRSDRTGSEISLILMDIDHFKSFNDTYGHPAGDAILRALGRLLQKETREIDIPARYGGEEFVVILVDTDIAGSEMIAERIRRAIEKMRINHEGNEFNITVSIGISTYPVLSDNKTELIDFADRALYFSKSNGRNRSCHWLSIKDKEDG